jgi:hypothetical protein
MKIDEVYVLLKKHIVQCIKMKQKCVCFVKTLDNSKKGKCSFKGCIECLQ